MGRWDGATFLDRFEAKYVPEPNSGCWIWVGGTGNEGYGRVYFKGRMRLAHRAAYEFFVGPVPHGLDLDHLCRTRCCVNPNHVEPVTRSENMRRSPLMDRNSHKTHCANGHQFTGSNLIINNRGARVCRACALAATKRHRERRRAS